MFANTKLVKLEQNYRSSQPILDLTNALISKAKERYAKTLFTDRNDGALPMFVEAKSEYDQARYVTDKIKAYQVSGVPLSEIAVLMRSGWHSNVLEVQLQAAGISFVKFGGFKFMESSHIKDVVAYLRVMVNPVDSVSWNRVLLGIEGLGPKASSDVISELFLSKGKNQAHILSKFSKKSYFTELSMVFDLVFNSANLTVVQVLERVMVYYRPLFTERYDDYPKRTQDLDSLAELASRYETLSDFLAEVTLDPPESTASLERSPEADSEFLTVSTIHSAKGLEWKVVFLISAVDGFLPSAQSMGDLGQLEEERRLLYVALTRAKDELFIMKPRLEMQGQMYHRFGGMPLTEPSRFLVEGNLLGQFVERSRADSDMPKDARAVPSFIASYDSALDDPIRAKYRF
jgi:DNA helicase-2/ATP-dependent DNA helicase PcrA